MPTFDVVVVGGGPAGSSAASALALAGLRVALLEQSKLAKPCGGFLPTKALAHIPPDTIKDLLQNPIRAVRLSDQQSASITVNSSRTLGYMLRREQLDQRLLAFAEATGVTITRDCRALDCKRQGQKISVSTTASGTLVADYLIGADGVHSEVAVKSGVRGRFPRWQLAFSRVAELRWQRTPTGCPSDQMRLICLPVLGGMGWVFPLPDGANVGIAGSSLDLDRIQRRFSDLLTQVAAEIAPYDLVWQRGWWLPVGGWPRSTASERVLLAGDAAGYVDCFSGEGIYYAIVSGQLAAKAIVGSFSNWRQVERQYRGDCGQYLLPTLRKSLLFSGAMGRSKQRYQRALRQHPELASHLVRLMLEERPYDGELLPLLRSFLLAGRSSVQEATEVWVSG